MKKLLTMLPLVFFFSCTFQEKIVGDWTVYEEGYGPGFVTFNADNTAIFFGPPEYKGDAINGTWYWEDDNKILCIKSEASAGGEECYIVNWINNDLFHLTHSGVLKTKFERKK